jgi:hypothetical protein
VPVGDSSVDWRVANFVLCIDIHALCEEVLQTRQVSVAGSNPNVVGAHRSTVRDFTKRLCAIFVQPQTIKRSLGRSLYEGFELKRTVRSPKYIKPRADSS